MIELLHIASFLDKLDTLPLAANKFVPVMIRTVALLGADGNLGPSVYQALLANKFNVTVLKRASSKSKSSYPQTITIPDAFPIEDVVAALQGIDAVVVTIRGNDPTLQKRLADACVQAGVKRMEASCLLPTRPLL